MWLASSGPPGQVRVVAVDEPHDAGGPDLVAARLEHDLGEGLGGLAGDDHAVLGEVERGEVEGAGGGGGGQGARGGGPGGPRCRPTGGRRAATGTAARRSVRAGSWGAPPISRPRTRAAGAPARRSAGRSRARGGRPGGPSSPAP